MNERTLYERLGGFDAITAATDEVMKRLMNDPQFTRFFSGQSENRSDVFDNLLWR